MDGQRGELRRAHLLSLVSEIYLILIILYPVWVSWRNPILIYSFVKLGTPSKKNRQTNPKQIPNMLHFYQQTNGIEGDQPKSQAQGLCHSRPQPFALKPCASHLTSGNMELFLSRFWAVPCCAVCFTLYVSNSENYSESLSNLKYP